MISDLTNFHVRKKHINITAKTKSLSLLTLALFALTFATISDTQSAYGIEIFSPQTAVIENSFGDIAIVDVKVNENGLYLLYWDSANSNGLRLASSIDDGNTWCTSDVLETGFENFNEIPTEHIFINDTGAVG